MAVTTLVMVGKMAIAGSFAIIYNYTAELFPTGMNIISFRKYLYYLRMKFLEK